ncbi:Dirigent protein 19 [Bienertia sinuspersici]
MALQIFCKLLLFLSLTFFITSQAHFAEERLTFNELKATQKLTKLHFYFHEIPNGNHPTAVIIARPPNQTTVGFGTLVMIDDALTEGPELASNIVGRAQGMYGESSQSESSSLIMSLTFAFTQGKFNGSSISVLGRYRVADNQRELPIVGGSGVFRFAQGYALAKTYQFDPKTGNAISEYNVFVLHYDTLFMS